MYKVKMSSKGQIVLPAAIRKEYDLKPGSELAIVELAGVIYLTPVTDDPWGELCGFMKDTGYTTEQFLAERRAERDREEEKYRRWVEE